MQSTATPDHRPAWRALSRPVPASTSGSTAQGRTALGRISPVSTPSAPSSRGETAYPRPARMRAERRQAQGARDQAGALVGHDQQQRGPQPLDHPVGQAGEVTQQEEGSLREQVAVGLVLQLAERRVGVPEMERAGQERTRVGGQVELGVPRGLAGLLQERADDEEQPDQPVPGVRRPRLDGSLPPSNVPRESSARNGGSRSVWRAQRACIARRRSAGLAAPIQANANAARCVRCVREAHGSPVPGADPS